MTLGVNSNTLFIYNCELRWFACHGESFILYFTQWNLCEKYGFTNDWICSTIVTYYAFILGGLLYDVDCRWMERL